MGFRSWICRGGRNYTVSLKELRLDFEATLAEAIDGSGYAHYGYWTEGAPSVPTMKALGAAQQAYFDLMASRIPEGTKSILDVGSGTGANAAGFVKLGYDLECLCPSEHLNALARRKLPDSVSVHDTLFEAYETEKVFDLCLFAESFHYIELDTALAQLARYARNHVLIFDYFRKASNAEEDGTRGTHSEFLNAVEAQGLFEVVSDDDLTEAIIPTFAVLEHIRTKQIAPFVERARETFSKDYPMRTRVVEWLFGKTLRKIGRPRGRAEKFLATREYRLILMTRRQTSA